MKYTIAMALLCLCRAAYAQQQKEQPQFDGWDGPYITHDKWYQVTGDNILEIRKADRKKPFQVYAGNTDNDSFSVVLQKELAFEEDTYPLPQKIIAISDIEGNFNGFADFLVRNKVIDRKFNWCLGKGHLVLNGDFVDRGDAVMPVLWLIYKLEAQAVKQGGKVHYLLGNHEIMNFRGNGHYSRSKYHKVAAAIRPDSTPGASIRYLYSDSTETGKWLRRKNVIEQIGGYIFVHAGLSPKLLQFRLTIRQINRIARQNRDMDYYFTPGNNDTANLVTGREGPYWYRGMATRYKYYDKITATAVDSLLSFYQAAAIIIGHTPADDISTGFGGKVIYIDVAHGQIKNSSATKGLLIENRQLYRLDGLGNKTIIVNP